MIVAFGTSTPTSITVVATRTSSSRALKLRHHAAPLGRTQAAVQAADAVAAQLRRPEPLGLLLGRARDARLGGLDQRAHDVRLPPVVEMPAETRVRLGAAVVGHPRRDDRLAVGGRKRELARPRGRRRP